jgi:aminoglycoside phosphotransferase (APT) family kinase protein
MAILSHSDHPALAAWRAARPTVSLGGWAAETIEETKKTDAYILTRRTTGERIVAKRCTAWAYEVETTVYERVLDAAGVHAIRLVASLEDGDSSWLFLEYAAGDPYDPQDRGHRIALGRWLGRLHGAGARLPVADRLPDHGAGRYLEHLADARQAVVDGLRNPVLDASALETLEAVIDDCDRVRDTWGDIERVLTELPPTVVHGDLAPKNLRVVHRERGRVEIVAFDWETCGWGHPAPDLAAPITFKPGASGAGPDAYLVAVREFWPAVDPAQITRAIWAGTLVRYVAAMDWDATRLRFPSVRRPLTNLPLYCERIRRLLREGP